MSHLRWYVYMILYEEAEVNLTMNEPAYKDNLALKNDNVWKG